MSLALFLFQDSEANNEERPLGMPAVECSVDADEEDAFQYVFTAAVFMMKPWDVTFHFAAPSRLG